MTEEIQVSEQEIDQRLLRLRREAEAGGYHLNPDEPFTRSLVRGLLVNEKRYGYPACPCRLAAGSREADLDIICPCDYRDPDLNEHGVCYCALYVSQEVLDGARHAGAIPERRSRREHAAAAAMPALSGKLAYPVYRCRVCGYLCARDAPPETCPVCKAKKDRFEVFIS